MAARICSLCMDGYPCDVGGVCVRYDRRDGFSQAVAVLAIQMGEQNRIGGLVVVGAIDQIPHCLDVDSSGAQVRDKLHFFGTVPG